MAVTRVNYDASKIGSKLVAEGIDHLIKARAALLRAKSLADALSSGGVTPAALEGSAEFGVNTGEGSAFYTALNVVKTNLATITDLSLANLDAGG